MSPFFLKNCWILSISCVGDMTPLKRNHTSNNTFSAREVRISHSSHSAKGLNDTVVNHTCHSICAESL